jgi:hypothetical protein
VIDLTLTLQQQQRAMALAHERNGKDAERVASRKATARYTEQEAHFLGLLAEVGVADLLRLTLDERPFVGGDAGYDFLLPNGATLDVKVRVGWNKDLISFPDMHDFRADYALLTWLNGEKLTVVGLVSRERFAWQAHVADLTVGRRRLMNWRELRAI